MTTYDTIQGQRVPIKTWTRHVPAEDGAQKQLRETAQLPIVGPHIAVMPDVHWGMGSTVGSVVPTRAAIVPSCVGVDLGCGMTAMRTSLTSNALGDNAKQIFETISKAVPHGRTDNGGTNDRGAWRDPPEEVEANWMLDLGNEYKDVCRRLGKKNDDRPTLQLGTLGTGNHFIECCIDNTDHVWLMLHSGSRGVGNSIGQHFIKIAKKRCEKEGIALPNSDLAWLPEGTPEFDDYMTCIDWAQKYARVNREIMMSLSIHALSRTITDIEWQSDLAVSCHHNYVSRETHFGEELYITRKGAVSARKDELGIIPGSMGAKSFIVRGLGNADSFHSCSHGAGRIMSRGTAKKAITLEQHAKDTAGVVCKKDDSVIDESPSAYKSIDDVMRSQNDLVEIVYELKQVVCVKG